MPHAPLPFTPDDDANALLARDPLALLVGMLLDQQFPMERAFQSPSLLVQRLGVDHLDAAAIAATEPDTLVEVFQGPPALHRFPGSMAARTQELCRHIVEHHGGDAAAVWAGAADGADLYKRLRALPGFGEAKARIFVKVLGKRLGVAPPGWEEHAATWASIADVETFDDVATIRSAKKAAKAAGQAARADAGGKAGDRASGKVTGTRRAKAATDAADATGTTLPSDAKAATGGRRRAGAGR